SGTIEIDIRYEPVVIDRSEIFVYPDIYSRNAIHSESVYQALMKAGYAADSVDYADVRRFVDRVKGLRAPTVLRIDEVFSGLPAVAAL
ncbi:MAG: hypothetical protein LBG44_03385, partial [Gemmatimonadota bacterium]|nr:hypothetical protein [Gemmatimonadota bacterium]